MFAAKLAGILSMMGTITMPCSSVEYSGEIVRQLNRYMADKDLPLVVEQDGNGVKITTKTKAELESSALTLNSMARAFSTEGVQDHFN